MFADALVRHRVAALTSAQPADVDKTHRLRSPHPRRVVIAALTLLVWWAAGPVVVGATGIGWWGVARARPLLVRRRAAAAAAMQLPDALEMFVLMVHAGLTPRHAIELLSKRAPPAVRHGFVAVVIRLERGDVLADALGSLPDQLGAAALGLADLIGSADRYGLALGPVLEQLAQQARADRRRADEAAARSLPVKLSFPLVVCTLPSFVLLAIIPAVMAALSSLQTTTW